MLFKFVGGCSKFWRPFLSPQTALLEPCVNTICDNLIQSNLWNVWKLIANHSTLTVNHLISRMFSFTFPTKPLLTTEGCPPTLYFVMNFYIELSLNCLTTCIINLYKLMINLSWLNILYSQNPYYRTHVIVNGLRNGFKMLNNH